MLANLAIDGRKSLLVLAEADKNIVLSSRNIKNAKVTTASQLNTYDVLHADNLIISEERSSKIEELYN